MSKCGRKHYKVRLDYGVGSANKRVEGTIRASDAFDAMYRFAKANFGESSNPGFSTSYDEIFSLSADEVEEE